MTQPRANVGTTQVSSKIGQNVFVIGGSSSSPLVIADAPFTTELTGDISGSTTQVQLKVGSSDLANRRILTVQNTSALRIWVGPNGVDAGGTSDPGVWLNPGDIASWSGALAAITRYAISTGAFTAVVQEAS